MHLQLTLLFVTIFLTSCYNDNRETLYPQPPIDGCDTTNLSFSSDILPIMIENCATPGCHTSVANAAGYALDSYQGVRQAAVTDQRLLGTIKQDQGFSPMPKGNSKLPACEINKISAWIASGAQNN